MSTAASSSASASASTAAAAAASASVVPVGTSDTGESHAPLLLLPPLVSAYLPSQPYPSAVDSNAQRADQIQTIQGVTASSSDAATAAASAATATVTAGTGAGGATAESTSIQVKKRVRVTDGIRLGHRKRKNAPAVSRLTSGLGVKELPDRLDLCLPESGLVNQLLGLERRLDATIARKHVEIQQALSTSKQPTQILRVYIWHEHSTPLTKQEVIDNVAAHEKPETQAWLLKIQGQILEAEEGVHAAHSHGPRCMSNYLHSMVVEIENSNQAAANAPAATLSSSANTSALTSSIETIEWRKHSSVSLADGFEVRRRGGGDVNIKLTLFQDFSPPRFQLSLPMAQALGFPQYAPNPIPAYATPQQPNPFPLYHTQSHVLTSFWEYVKRKNLQDLKTPHVIQCDTTLQNLFGVKEVPVASILSFLQLHLAPASAEPIVIPYVIRPTLPVPAPPAGYHSYSSASSLPAPSPSNVLTYDILTYSPVMPNLQDSFKDSSVQSKDAFAQANIKAGVPPPNLHTLINRHSDKLLEYLLDIEHHNRRREFLTAFSEAPTAVMQLLISQQAKDNLLLTGVTGVDDEIERRAEFYHADWQLDAVDRYLDEESHANTLALQSSLGMFDEE